MRSLAQDAARMMPDPEAAETRQAADTSMPEIYPHGSPSVQADDGMAA